MSAAISVKEFKMWLQGVEEMQTEDWIPDARQWVKIREKIDQIADMQTTQTAIPDNQTRVARPLYNNDSPVEIPPQFTIPIPQMPPTGLSGVPLATSESMKVTTPNIDTSNGQYKSQFA